MMIEFDFSINFLLTWGSSAWCSQRVFIPTEFFLLERVSNFKFSIKICNKLFYLLSRCFMLNPTSLPGLSTKKKRNKLLHIKQVKGPELMGTNLLFQDS